jgi:transposase-like protein
LVLLFLEPTHYIKQENHGGGARGTLAELISIAKEIPESHLDEAPGKLKEIWERAEIEADEESGKTGCPHCGSSRVRRNGHKCGKQAYLCQECKKSYVATTMSAIENLNSSPAVWKQVIRDTADGVPLDCTAESLALSHATVFRMRHKILYAIERSAGGNPAMMFGVCEADETYVPESVKGRKIPEGCHRAARKHGATAEKRGLSSECISAYAPA